jgi:hypothetical protein
MINQYMENCKGCKDKVGLSDGCYFVRYVTIFTCPCFVCIVKSMCEGAGDICKDFEDFITRCAEGTNFLNGKLI